jgi:leucyl aminopeptidase
MKITWTTKKYEQIKADVVAVPYYQRGDNAAFDALDRKARKALSTVAKTEKFTGQDGRTVLWRGKVGARNCWVMIVGMGSAPVGPNRWRRSIAKAMHIASRRQLGTLAVFVDGAEASVQVDRVRWTVEALSLGGYRFRKYKTRRKIPFPKEAIIGVYPSVVDEPGCVAAVREAKAAAAGVAFTRDLVNEPANVLSPEKLAEIAQSLAEKKKLECTIMDEDQIRDLGMNLFLSVASGSDRPPRFIHLVYKPRGEAKGVVALVGKGITFDSGGLSIKIGKSMYDMKTDMAGAGVVLGVMSALSALKPEVEVHGIIPTTDNAINGHATRPGDVFKSLSGKTVEVLNTDAEGRLILADALTYAEQQKPDVIIDHATLTGACVVALGPNTAGVFASEDETADAYLGAADRAGELVWRLPLAKDLKRDLRSDVADLKNIGGAYGGAITAALFLQNFVKKTPWVHVDIAGPARADNSSPLGPRGATGFGVLAALQYLSEF